MTCPYITTLERACGRASTHGEHCRFHHILVRLTNEFPPVGPTRRDEILKLYNAIGEQTK